jgi:hypothetical protein
MYVPPTPAAGADVMMLPGSACAEMMALPVPEVDTNCTAPSLIPTRAERVFCGGQVRKSVANTAAAPSKIGFFISSGMRKISRALVFGEIDEKLASLAGKAPAELDGKELCREKVSFLKEIGHGMTSVRGAPPQNVH